ncbi:MAG: DUF624 domain-containing protein [Ruminococcaceae bacterium]|nr:DUF624 domain-containing protein [Oscillospiraceae bacterium]
MYNEEQPKKKRFKLFDTQREGKGVSKEEANLPPGLKKFFLLYRRDFGRLLSVNILMVLGNFPLLFLIVALSGVFNMEFAAHAEQSYTAFSGILAHEGMSAPLLALGGIVGAPTLGSIYTLPTYIFMGIGALTVFTFGLVNVGTTYLLRNMVIGEPVFIWSDFWYAVRRNFKQGFLFGILDILLIALIPINVMILSQGAGFVNGLLFWLNLVIGVLYVMMRCYIYLQMITFDLSIRKILKNSLIFAFIGIKRLILAFLGNLILIFIVLGLAYSGAMLALAVALPLTILFSNCAYMTTYAAYFKIKEVMIDAYGKTEESNSISVGNG